ncbi:aldo/keto reductase [Amycolatopsis nigrescens]|uniref:aldo/keto reductase n=1 Tax=Amycolatopsis nigrescens TaxID=381445 RepID=UPI000361A6CD|nr:aldo/keto reductase [Amycolatopsis nigrescens]
MEFRRLGGSGLLVSELSYGNWLTHGSATAQSNAPACVHAALDAGINLFSTAAAWGAGDAEVSLAKALRATRRDDLVLCSGVYWPEGPSRNASGLSRKHLHTSLHGSLRRLETDYLDVYQLLRFDYQTPLEETFLALSDLVRHGKILYVGTSEWSAEQLLRASTLAAELRVPLVANQPHYSMLWRVPEAQVMPVCRRAGIGQLVSLPLAQGLLTGKYCDGGIPAGSRAAGDEAARQAIWPLLNKDLLDRIGLLRGVAAHAGLSMAQLAIAWTLQHEDVASAVTGASTPDQITENAKAAGITLDFEVLTQIDELLGTFVQTDPRLTFSPPQYR